MTGPSSFEEGLTFFNNGKYFEAHEVWEDLWRKSSGSQKTFYQGLIQAAVGLHHFQRGNGIGARAQFAKSIRNLSNAPEHRQSLDIDDLMQQLRDLPERLAPGETRIVQLK